MHQTDYDQQTPAAHQTDINELVQLRRALQGVVAFHDMVAPASIRGVTPGSDGHVRISLAVEPGFKTVLTGRFEVTIAEARWLSEALADAVDRATTYSQDELATKIQRDKSRGADRPISRLATPDTSFGVCPKQNASSAASAEVNGPSTRLERNQTDQPTSPGEISTDPHGVSNAQ